MGNQSAPVLATSSKIIVYFHPHATNCFVVEYQGHFLPFCFQKTCETLSRRLFFLCLLLLHLTSSSGNAASADDDEESAAVKPPPTMAQILASAPRLTMGGRYIHVVLLCSEAFIFAIELRFVFFKIGRFE
jgi:hypothetical protein